MVVFPFLTKCCFSALFSSDLPHIVSLFCSLLHLPFLLCWWPRLEIFSEYTVSSFNVSAAMHKITHTQKLTCKSVWWRLKVRMATRPECCWYRIENVWGVLLIKSCVQPENVYKKCEENSHLKRVQHQLLSLSHSDSRLNKVTHMFFHPATSPALPGESCRVL